MARTAGRRRRCLGVLAPSIAALLSACPIDERLPRLAGGTGGSDAQDGGGAGRAGGGGATEPGAAGSPGGGGMSGEGRGVGGEGGSGTLLGVDAGSLAPPAEPDGGGPPPGEPPPAGPLTGELSSDEERVLVSSDEGRSYIVLNDFDEAAGTQTLSYTGPSFTIAEQTGVTPNGNVFGYPRIYIGRYGAGTGDGLTTTANDNLPQQVSQISSIPATVSHNASGDASAELELWFARQPPTGTYEAADLYVTVWLYQPPGRNPYGTQRLTGLTFAGAPGTWSMYTGPHDFANATVISYVPSAPVRAASLDLAPFVADARARPEGSGLTNMFLTDVFFGFEIWSGGTGLSLSDFSVRVE